MTTPTLREILIGQWQDAPHMRAIADDVLQPILDDAVEATADMQRMLDVDEAEGIWLVRLGQRLGIEQPSTSDPAQDTRFGFDGAGAGFDQHPFRGAAVNDAVYPLPDTLYRRMVKARAIMVLSDGTIYTFIRAVKAIDPHATVVDNRDMTVTITTSLRELMELADEIGALPRTGGVQIVYV